MGLRSRVRVSSMRIGRIKTRVTRVGRIDARGVLAGCKVETETQKR